MTTGVILSTYNGKLYIKEQLLSLLNQTRKIDTVLIIDDCSTDNTVSIIREFINYNRLSNWKVLINEQNQGWKQNFYNGIDKIEADIIFPCDQDDIWHLNKVESMSAILEHNSNIMVLEGQPHKFFDENNHTTQTLRTVIGTYLDKHAEKKYASTNSGKVYQKKFDSSFLRRAPGCTLAFRKTFFDKIKTEWFPEMPHDALLTYFPAAAGSYYIYDQNIIEWRQHVGSASRPKERTRERRLSEISLDQQMLLALYNFSVKDNIDPLTMDIIKQAQVWNECRNKLVSDRNLFYAFKLLFYKRFYSQGRRYLTDIKYALER